MIPTWIETFEDLQSASTVEELWGVLLGWHGIRNSSVWDEPYLLFIRFHRHDSTKADVTAALLCSDHRWRNAAHHLIDRLTTSDVLDDEQLDRLAAWFTGETFETQVETADGQHRNRASTIRRPIWPPLRRWAARHEVARHPERWRAVIDASTALPSRDAAATIAGVMDAADHIPPDQRATLAEVGLNHGSGTVRLAALPIIAATSGTDAAITAAQQDPSAKVRAWKPNPSATARTPDATAEPSGSANNSTDVSISQASLFDT
jgi:hypothetical protein